MKFHTNGLETWFLFRGGLCTFFLISIKINYELGSFITQFSLFLKEGFSRFLIFFLHIFI